MTFDGRTFSSIYATTNSVITFGAPDGTYWTYPSTPSISLYSFDWVVYPGARADEHLIIRSSDGGFQVDMSARPIWLQNATEPTNIVITAAILSDGTVAMAYTLSGPEYPEYSPRTGVRLNDGTIETFEEYGIQETEETPELAPEPTEEAPFTPEPEPTQSPEPPAPFLNAPTNVSANQLQDGSVQITWDIPTETSTAVERYAVSWSTDNFQSNGWGVASSTNSITISRDAFSSTGGLDQTYQFRIRSDNDTLSIYSSYSPTISAVVASPPPPPPTIPDGASVVQEGTSFSVVAPEGQRISNVVGYYGDPNDSTRGGEVSSILFELLAGSTSATVEVTNETFANDPAPGTPKILIILITYENLPVQPTPEPTPAPVEPIPTPEPTPVQPVEPTPQPTPEVTQPPVVQPTPEPTQTPGIIEPEKPIEETVEPKPQPTPEPAPTPTIPPTQEPTPEPTPSEKPIEKPTENEPEPLPEPESPSPSEELGELASLAPEELTVEQAEELFELAIAVFETAEKGSEEYQEALEALMVVAEANDPELPTELAAIPLLGDLAGAVLDVFNSLGNVGSDMSPEVRETAEDMVVVSVVVAQIVGVSAISAMSSTTIRRP